MGKSSTVHMLRYLGYPVFDADATVADFYRRDQKFIKEIETLFPETLDSERRINKGFLAQKIFADHSARKILEALVHPRVAHAAERFTMQHQILRAKMVFWDVPLLFQSEMQFSCDEIWLVSAPETLQRRRALQRKGWDRARFEAIRKLQIAPETQQKMADRVLATGIGKAHTLRCLKRCIVQCFT